jgi:hypothetical protein
MVGVLGGLRWSSNLKARQIPRRSRIDGGRGEWLPNRQKVDESCTLKPPARRGFSGAPGATRTPNLLIRKSPKQLPWASTGVHTAGTMGFRVHRNPRLSGGIHREWLATWLPESALASVEQQRCWLPRRPITRNVWLGAQIACFRAHPAGPRASRSMLM